MLDISEAEMNQHSLETPYKVGNVHIYTAETSEGVILFDAGAKTDWTAEYMRSHIDLDRLRYVFITHCHVDHCGMLSFLEQNSDAEIFISKYDKVIFEAPTDRYAMLADILKESGFPPSMIESSLGLFDFSGMQSKRYSILEDSADKLKKLNMSFMRCPGHSQSDIVYLYDGYAVTGDILLEGIVTVPLMDVDFDNFAGRFDSYRAYCDTFVRMIGLKGYTFMPGHRERIKSPAECVAYYVSKMADRALRLKDRLKREKVFEIVEDLVPEAEKNPVMSYIKASEIYFLKDMLEDPSYITDRLKEVGLYDRLEQEFKSLI